MDRKAREVVLGALALAGVNAGSGVDLQARGVHHLKGVPEPYELFSLVDGRVAPVPVAARRPALKVSDRVVLAAARRAPRLLRAMNRN